MLTVHCQVGKLATEPGLDRTTALVLSQQCGTLMTVGAPLAVPRHRENGRCRSATNPSRNASPEPEPIDSASDDVIRRWEDRRNFAGTAEGTKATLMPKKGWRRRVQARW